MAEPQDISKMKLAYRERNEGDFPQILPIVLELDSHKKYGENPSQHCATYHIFSIGGKKTKSIAEDTDLKPVHEGKGGLSLTNEMDITRAIDVLKFFSFSETPAVAIMKHNIVSGFAKQTKESQSMAELFRYARDADLRSNFGGTAVFPEELDMQTAEAIFELKGTNPFFIDVIAAPGYKEGVVGYLEKSRKEMRIASFSNIFLPPAFKGEDTEGLFSLKEMPTGRMGVQDLYLSSIEGVENLVLRPMVIHKEKQYAIETEPTPEQVDDLLTAWYLNIAGARSNGVVFVKDGISVAIGSGQVERVGAVEQAIVKGMQKAMDREGIKYNPLMGIVGSECLSKNPFEGAVCSSDAFFPFRDSIDTIASVGVKAIIQPYGSNKDYEVIQAANEHKIAMPATLERCFGHW